jgi:hypothetical protein
MNKSRVLSPELLASSLELQRKLGVCIDRNCSDSHHMKGVGTVIWFHVERSNGRILLAGL